MSKLFTKYREPILYIFFGVLTTLVNMIVFQGLQWLLRPYWDRAHLLNNPIAFIAALVFAFVVNKLWVFRQKSWERRAVLREAATFTAARLFSFGLDYVLTIVFFDFLWPLCEGWFAPLWPLQSISPENGFRFLAKWGIIAALVVVLNYFFSKWVVFKKTSPSD